MLALRVLPRFVSSSLSRPVSLIGARNV